MEHVVNKYLKIKKKKLYNMNITWNRQSKYPYTPGTRHSSRKDATAKGNNPLALLYLGTASNAARNNQRAK